MHSSPCTAIDHALASSDPRLPARFLAQLGDVAPARIAARGNIDVLGHKKLALFCSRKCPGKLILQTYDLAQQLRDRGVTVIGGFHSPMEQECLRILLSSPYAVVICPARNLPTRIAPEWKRPLEDGRLLLLTPFDDTTQRVTEATAQRRNRFVAAVADEIFIAYAEPASQTELLCREIVSWGKKLLTLPAAENRNLHELGAVVCSSLDLSGRGGDNDNAALHHGFEV